MRDIATDILYNYGISKCKGFDYLIEAVLLYDGNTTLKDIYGNVARIFHTTPTAVEKNIAICVDRIECDSKITPKAFIAGIKERIMFGFVE